MKKLDKQTSYKLNCIFVVTNLLQDIFLELKYNENIRHEFKQDVNTVLANLNKINRIPEKLFDENKIDDFDKAKAILKRLTEYELVAHFQNRQTEFFEYIEKFFEKPIQQVDFDENNHLVIVK